MTSVMRFQEFWKIFDKKLMFTLYKIAFSLYKIIFSWRKWYCYVGYFSYCMKFATFIISKTLKFRPFRNKNVIDSGVWRFLRGFKDFAGFRGLLYSSLWSFFISSLFLKSAWVESLMHKSSILSIGPRFQKM